MRVGGVEKPLSWQWMWRWVVIVIAVTTEAAVAQASQSWLGGGWEVFHVVGSSAVSGIAQDGDGRIWIGNQGGLAQIQDGASVARTVAATPTLGLVLSTTSDGKIWIGRGRGFLRPRSDGSDGLEIAERGWDGLAFLRGDSVDYLGEGASTARPFVWALHTSRGNGELLVGTETGLARMKGDAPVMLDATGWPASHVLSVASTSDGAVWVGTVRGLVHLKAGVTKVPIVGPAVSALAVEPDGGLWIGSGRGLLVLDGEAPVSVPGLATPVSALLRDAHGRLWVGTPSGLAIVDVRSRRVMETLQVEDGLTDARILTLFEDRDGAVWVGTRAGGAMRLRPRRTWNAGLREGLSGTTAFAIVRHTNESMLAATEGGVSRHDSTGWRSVLDVSALGFEPRSLAVARDGAAFVAGPGSSRIVRLGTERTAVLAAPAGRARSGVRALFVDRDDALWIAWSDGVVSRHRASAEGIDEGTVFDRGLCHAPTTAIHQDVTGSVWLATEGGGAAIVTGDTPRCLTLADGLPSNIVTGFADDGAGGVWIGTRMDSGLARWKNGTLSRVGSDAGLYLDSVNALTPDGRGGLWMICGGGVAWTTFAALAAWADARQEPVFTRTFDMKAGMRAQEGTFGAGPPGALDRQGRLWVATLQGVSVLDDVPRTTPAPPPRPAIAGISVNGEPRALTELVTVRDENPTVLFRFLTADVEVPRGQIRFRYRLVGQQPEWRWTSSLEAKFPALPDGRYAFELQSSNGWGAFSVDRASVALVVRRPFHRTMLFYVMLTGALALAAFGILRARLRVLSARHTAVLNDRKRIAMDLHDVIGQSFASIGLMLDSIRAGATPSTDALVIAERARKVLDYCSADVRRTIWQLRDGSMEPPSIDGLIHRCVQAFADAAAAAHLSVTVRPGRIEFAPTAQTLHEIPFVLTEALTNVVRHARASHAVVQIESDASGFVLIVEDDGAGSEAVQGLGPQELADRGHFGLAGMHERARRVGGDVKLETRAGGGSRLIFHVPINQSKDAEIV